MLIIIKKIYNIINIFYLKFKLFDCVCFFFLETNEFNNSNNNPLNKTDNEENDEDLHVNFEKVFKLNKYLKLLNLFYF